MGVFRFSKSRYPLNLSFLCPTSLSSNCKTLTSPTPLHASDSKYFAISSLGHPSFFRLISYVASKFYLSSIVPSGYCSSIRFSTSYCIRNVCLLSNQRKFLSSSSSINTLRASFEGQHCAFGVYSGDFNRIIDIIKSDGSDMEARLDAVGSKLSKWSIAKILQALNVTKVPAMRFFEWVRDVHPNHSRNADICSLMIDNCGQLGDYGTMLGLLKDYRAGNICLSDKAFGFLPILSSSKETAEKSIRGVITVLNEVGGSCRNSGIHSLLESLCTKNSFDLANFVIEITERRVSYYNILMCHICVRGQFEDARHIIEEMWQVKCDPDARTYNLLISTFCKRGRIEEAFLVQEEMIKRGCPPDEITYEILIYFACRYRRSDHASQFYNQMISRGIRPRLLTHYAFIRGYFNSQQLDEAYRYVVDTAAEHPWSAEGVYNVLAGLHVKHGDLLVANKLLLEMFQKGIKPKYSLYQRVSKCLTGKEGFATNLNAKYSSFMLKCRENTSAYDFHTSRP